MNCLIMCLLIKEQVHIMQTDIEPEESAAEYEKILHDYFDDSPFI